MFRAQGSRVKTVGTMNAGRRSRGGAACICMAALLPAAVFLMTGCESTQTEAAHKISDALPRAIGPAQHYSVHVSGDLFALMRGHAQRIQVQGQEVQVAPSATLDALSADARGVSFDPQTQRIHGADTVTFVGTIGQTNLSQYVAAHHANLPGLTVRLRTSDVLARLPINTSGLHTHASVSGTLAPDSNAPDRLDFVANAASLGVLPVPAMLVNAALSLINPVFDLSHIKFPVVITQASVVNHQIVLRGTASFPSQAENGQAPSSSSH